MTEITEQELFKIWFDCLCHRLASVIFSSVKEAPAAAISQNSDQV